MHKTLCLGCLGPERGISKFQSCSDIHSRDKAYTVGLIIASEFVRQGVRGSNQRGTALKLGNSSFWPQTTQSVLCICNSSTRLERILIRVSNNC